LTTKTPNRTSGTSEPPRLALTIFFEASFSICLILGSLGLIIALKIPASIWRGLDALLRLDFDPIRMDERGSPLDDLHSPFPLFPMLVVGLWLVGAFGLLTARKSARGKLEFAAFPVMLQNRMLWGIGLVGALLAGWAVRSAQLLPDSAGRWSASNYDEMVYFSAASQLAQGHLPYRDFFLAHPPGALLMLAPISKLFGAMGGAEAYSALRWLTVIAGLVTCAGVAWAGSRMWGNKGISWGLPGSASALILALDVRASQIATLETISNLFAVFAFICLLEGLRKQINPLWFAGAGALAGMAFLSKLPGIAVIFGFLVYLAWKRNWRGLGWTTAGFTSLTALIVGFFGLAGGIGQFIRQVFFFQLLRPQEVAEGRDQIGRLAEEPQAALTLLLAGMVFCIIAWRLIRRKTSNDIWLIPATWSLPLLATLLVGKSFHPWYYAQLALPLALLVGGLFIFEVRKLNQQFYTLAATGIIAMLLIIAPMAARQWLQGQSVTVDRVYHASGEYFLQQPTSGSILSFDPGFAFLSEHEPARTPDGKFLVDSAGYMVYLNLDIDRRSLGEMTGQIFNLNRERGQVDNTFQKERAQAIISATAISSSWIALDGKIALPQLTPTSVEYFQTLAAKALTLDYVELYQSRFQPSPTRFSNGLILYTFGTSSSFQGKANYDSVGADGVLRLKSKDSGTRTLDLRLVWETVTTPPQQAKVFIHLIDEKTGQRVAQRDLLPLDDKGDTRTWRKGDFYQDVHSLPLPPNLPIGRYRIIVGLYDAANSARIPLADYSDAYTLGYVEVTS